MKKSMFMLCLGFMGLQGADARTRITTHDDGKVTVERVPPEYQGRYPNPAVCPSAPTIPQQQSLDLSQFPDDVIQTALIARELAKQGVDMHQTRLPQGTTSHYRSTGPLPVPSRLQQRFESGPFDASATDSDSDNSPQAAKPTHQRQRSLSDTDALTAKQQPSSNPIDDTNSLQRWRQPTSPLTLDDFNLNVLSPHSKTVFQELAEAVGRVKADIYRLLDRRYKALAGVEERAEAPTSLQKATAKEREKQRDRTRKASVALCKIEQILNPLITKK